MTPEIRDIDITLTLQPDGSALIRERWDVCAADGTEWYLVRGNLGDIENAVKCYARSTEMDPNYVYGVYSVGNTYFDEAIAIQEKMNALDLEDVEGYDALQKEFEKYLEMSVEPFERAFNMTDDQDIKVACASALKQVCFRFRTRDAKYAEGYEKYNNYLNEAGVQ